MERIRCVVCGLLLTVVLSFCPSVAYASDGFMGGLEDLIGTREVEQKELGSVTTDVQFAQETELGEVREGPTIGATSDMTPMNGLRSFVSGFKFDFNGVAVNLWRHINPMRVVIILSVTAGVLFVFFWWGVRKSIRLIFGALRKGRASL